MLRSFPTLSVLALVLGSVVAACKGSRGDSCRMESDCESSLICCNAGSPATGGERGECQTECVLSVSDAGVDPGP